MTEVSEYGMTSLNQLNTGVTALASGGNTLAEAMKEFDKEGDTHVIKVRNPNFYSGPGSRRFMH